MFTMVVAAGILMEAEMVVAITPAEVSATMLAVATALLSAPKHTHV